MQVYEKSKTANWKQLNTAKLFKTNGSVIYGSRLEVADNKWKDYVHNVVNSQLFVNVIEKFVMYKLGSKPDLKGLIWVVLQELFMPQILIVLTENHIDTNLRT